MAVIIISGFIAIIMLQCLAVIFHTACGFLNKKTLNGIILYVSYIFILICEIISICFFKCFEYFFLIFFVVMSVSFVLRNFIFNSLFIRLLFFVAISLPSFEIEKYLFYRINIIYLISCIFTLSFDLIKRNCCGIKNIYRKFFFSFVKIYTSVIYGMILYSFGYNISSYIVVIITAPIILEHSRILDMVFSYNIHTSFGKENKQEGRKENKQEEFRKLWFRLCQESQGKVFETLLKRAFQVARGNDRRVIAKSFYGLVLQWVFRTPFEGQFREAWRGVLRKHVQGEKVVFSWDCLISLSRLVMGFAVLCAEYHAEKAQSQKRDGQKKSSRQHQKSRQEYRQRHGDRRQARRSARVLRPWHVVLAVSETASVEEIKKAYRKKIIENHPDRFAHQGEEKRLEAEEMSKEINEAFQYIRKYKCF